MIHSRAVEPIQDVLPSALAELLRQAPFSPGKLQFAWKAAVGPGIERATAIVLEADGTLAVRVSGPFWRKELERSLPVIRRRLALLLGERTVKGISIRD